MTEFERRLDPDAQLSPEEALEQDRILLNELEPEAGRLYDRHARSPRSGSPTSTSRTAWAATSTRTPGRPTSRA